MPSPIYVVAKQWMWKAQYSDGRREINELHVPVGRPVKLIMTSQDVIHSFFVPAFRIKQDVLPNRYTTIWFQATKPGKYHLFCAEYCGTKHSGMIGWIYAMDRQQYQQWLAQGAAEGSLASREKSCSINLDAPIATTSTVTAHVPTSRTYIPPGPTFERPDGTPTNRTCANRSSIRGRRSCSGFANLMPTFKGQLTGRAAHRPDCVI